MRHIRPAGAAIALACGLGLTFGVTAPAGAGPVHGATAQTAAVRSVVLPAPAATTVPTLRRGSKGDAVLVVQKRLTALGYWLGKPNGLYGDNTVHAVTALQKVAGLPRDGVLGPATRKALNRGVLPRVTVKAGRVVEISIAKQVMVIAKDGKVLRTIDVSTGSNRLYKTADGGTSRAVTPKGTFKVQRQISTGWRKAPLGLLYRPKYFNGGIAVHGSLSVPNYPASHGCVRVTLAEMDMLYADKLMPIGAKVKVY